MQSKPRTKFEVGLVHGVVFEICSIVCQKLYATRELGHAHFQGNLFVRPLGIPGTKLHTKLNL